MNKDKKQEIESQKYRIIHDCQRHQEIKLWVKFIQRNVNTFSISCIHASALQSNHITSDHQNICWTQQRIWNWEHSRKENN